MVDGGRVDRHDAELPGDGRRRLWLGCFERPYRAALGRPRGRSAPRPRPLPREPRTDPATVSDRVRSAGRNRRRQLLHADDRRGDGVDHGTSGPCRFAGFGRRRRRADDDVAVRRMAHHADGLASCTGRPGRPRVGRAHPCGAPRAPATGRTGFLGRTQRFGACGNVPGRCAALDAIHHPRAHVLRLLRGARGSDLPHGKLCHDLRPSRLSQP